MNDAAQTISMDMEKFRSMLLDSVGVGLAVVEHDTFDVLLHNAMFGEWFPGLVSGEMNLADIIANFDGAKIHERIYAGETWKCEVEVKPKRWAITLAIEFVHAEGAGHDEIMIQ